MNHVHVVLDEQHGAPLGLELMDVLEQALLERRVDAGHRLVEHDQLWIGHQRSGHLQQLALSTGEVAGELVAHVVEAEALEQLVGAFGDRPLLDGPQELPRRRPQPFADLAGGSEAHVLDHGQAGEVLVSWNVRTIPRRASRCGDVSGHWHAVEVHCPWSARRSR